MQLIIWRHFQLQIPDEWEMLLFTRSLQAGRCVFADRYQHRLQFNWTEVPGTPDFNHIISEYQRQLEADDEVDHVQVTNLGNWYGVTARTGEVVTSRYVNYFASERCLIEMVFLWPEARDRQLERRVLTAICSEPAGDQALQRWRAYGMEMHAARELALTTCISQPANVRMVFTHEKHQQRQEQFERLGLVPLWLKGSLRDWLRARAPIEVKVRAQAEQEADGHTVVTLTGDSPARGLARVMNRKVAYDAGAWICPRDGRLYCYTLTGHAREAHPADIAGSRLVCCEQLRLAS